MLSFRTLIFYNSKITEVNESVWPDELRYYRLWLRPYRSLLPLLTESTKRGIENDINPNTIRPNWRNIRRHSIAVGKVAEIIARNIRGKSLPEIDEVVVGGLFHDFTKGEEIAFRRLKRSDQRKKIESFINQGFGPNNVLQRLDENPDYSLYIFEELVHEKDTREIIQNHRDKFEGYGNPDMIFRLAAAAGAPILFLEKDLQGHQLRTLGERIIFVADGMTDETKVVDLVERRKIIASRYGDTPYQQAITNYLLACQTEIESLIGISEGKLAEFVNEQLNSDILSLG